jgi:hypothetical protein
VDFSEKTLRIEESTYRRPSHSTNPALNPKVLDSKKLAAKTGQLFDVKYDKLVIAVGC